MSLSKAVQNPLTMLTKLVMCFIKTVVGIYSFVTYPIFYLIDKPKKKIANARSIKARQENPMDPDSPWVSTERKGTELIPLVLESRTVEDAINRAIREYGGKRRCYGYRQVLSEEQVEGKDGKKVKKYRLSDYKWLTYYEYEKRMINFARGLAFLGVRPQETVMIYCETRVEWVIAAHGVIKIGAVLATLYSTLNPEGVEHGINETKAKTVITSNELLPRLIDMQKKLKTVKQIIVIEDSKPFNALGLNVIKLFRFSEVERSGSETSEHISFKSLSPSDVALIMYTSGSTGIPKGVLLTHKNILSAVRAFSSATEKVLKNTADERYIGYLPLAHIMEFCTELVLFLNGIMVGYSSPQTLIDTSTGIYEGDHGDAVLLKPTVLPGVPLVFDRIRKGIYDKVNAKSQLSKSLFEFLLNYKIKWTNKGFNTPLTNKVFCSKFREMIGGELRYIVCGGAAISPATQEMVRACFNVQFTQGYGATETCAAALMGNFEDIEVGYVGSPLAETKIKLASWKEGGYLNTDKPNPRGEIVCALGSVAQGYFNLKEETEKAFKEEDGLKWFYSGDIGEITPNGVFKIIDRKKDLVKLANGEYASLGNVRVERNMI